MLPFAKFTKSFSTLNVVEGNAAAQYIYENILGDPGVRARMALASEFGIPAMSVCAREIEAVGDQPGSGLDLDNVTVKQSIGRMVKESLREFGYVPVAKKGKCLSASLQLKHFEVGAVYKRDKKIEPKIALEILLTGGVEYHEVL